MRCEYLLEILCLEHLTQFRSHKFVPFILTTPFELVNGHFSGSIIPNAWLDNYPSDFFESCVLSLTKETECIQLSQSLSLSSVPTLRDDLQSPA